MPTTNLSRLRALDAELIGIIGEAVAEAEPPFFPFSGEESKMMSSPAAESFPLGRKEPCARVKAGQVSGVAGIDESNEAPAARKVDVMAVPEAIDAGLEGDGL